MNSQKVNESEVQSVKDVVPRGLYRKTESHAYAVLYKYCSKNNVLSYAACLWTPEGSEKWSRKVKNNLRETARIRFLSKRIVVSLPPVEMPTKLGYAQYRRLEKFIFSRLLPDFGVCNKEKGFKEIGYEKFNTVQAVFSEKLTNSEKRKLERYNDVLKLKEVLDDAKCGDLLLKLRIKL